MRNITISLLSIVTLLSCTNSVDSNNNSSTDFKSVEDSVSYIIGVQTAKDFIKGFNEVNLDAYISGITDGLDSTITPKINDEIGGPLIQQYFMKKQAAQQELAKKELEPVIKEGEEFLANNGTREGVTTTTSGLQYEIITQGTGAKPSLTDEVETHYHGTLLDGTVFDSSVERGESISFPVNGVIPGWTEALQLMNVGSKWRLYIPYKLAYGERGNGPIGPYSTLIFELELLGVK